MTILIPGLRFMQAPSHGGAYPAVPKYLAQHSLEANPYDSQGKPRKLAWDLTTGWLQNDDSSVDLVVDFFEACQACSLDLISYALGGGNAFTYSTEHTGYAADSYEQWHTPSQLQCCSNSVKAQYWIWKNVIAPAHGFNYAPRFLTTQEIRDGELGGLITHGQARDVWGGTTHWDPGPNFFYAEMQTQFQQLWNADNNGDDDVVSADDRALIVRDILNGIENTDLDFNGRRVSIIEHLDEKLSLLAGQQNRIENATTSLTAATTALTAVVKVIQANQSK